MGLISRVSSRTYRYEMFFSRLLFQKFSRNLKVQNTSMVRIDAGRIPLKVIPINIYDYKNGDHCIIEGDTFEEHDGKPKINNNFHHSKSDHLQTDLDTAMIKIDGKDYLYDNVKELKVHVPIFSTILTVNAEDCGQKIQVQDLEPTKLKIYVGKNKIEKWESRIDETQVVEGQSHQYSPDYQQQKYKNSSKSKQVKLTPVDQITEVTLSNIKALRSIQVKSTKHPVKLITNRSLQTMRLTTVFGHLDSSIDFNGAVRCKILDVEAGKITSKKSLMLKQGVVMSTSGDIDLKTVSASSVLGVSSKQSLLIREVEGSGVPSGSEEVNNLGGEISLNANKYMDVWIAPTCNNKVNISNVFGVTDLYMADKLRGNLKLDLSVDSFMKTRAQILSDSNLNLVKDDILNHDPLEGLKSIPNVDRRLLVKLAPEQEDNDHSKYRKSIGNPNNNLHTPSDAENEHILDMNVKAYQGELNIQSMSWLKAAMRKLKIRWVSALDRINEEHSSKEITHGGDETSRLYV